ncbi:ATP-binding cassette domain-containing protein [Achromobacter insolitus]|uniref:ATP-binding cassette domain-containing protein n=1 Tax=Achromobacter TaxID=222 RepID=UPI000AEB1B34|nr:MULTISPECIES: ATP-binding cassette domain-containing protein [Achromobacter]AVG41860.1 sulfonate ABC transporter ATP-binding protein [Achromobacter insolitus]AXA74082.1 sulfonate ABC transporter ATP-binding protein [Achromobacter insolitus]MEB3095076.1 ATP-binding cassette domain-containing protein [Achromobacter sp. D10]QEK90575.1 ATP-binding cassette domain-containing protein [Achromobacter insolitus]
MMFTNPNEFELLQYLESHGQIEPDAEPDAGAQPALRVTLRKLARRFDGRVALQALDLEIAPGEFVAVVGSVGSGKSTLLRLLAGQLAPTDERGGEPSRSPLLFDNFPSWAPDSRVRLLLPDARLLPWKTVLQNVALGLAGTAQAADALRQVGLDGHGGDWPAQVSEPQRQRVALARALARRPGLLLLDEPYAGLDALARIEMQRLLEDCWRQQGFTAVLATHDAAEAVTVADRILVLDEGGVALDERVGLARPRARGSAAFAALQARVLRAALRQQDTPDTERPLAPVIQIRHLKLAV